MKIILDGKQMKDRSLAHEYIQKTLELPEYYGKNLDALFDLLTEMGHDKTIVIEDSQAIRASLGEYGQSLIDVFTDAANEIDDLTVEIK